jgi:hypothetical protein
LAVTRVEQLAQRWLYQYLPDRLQAYRQSALTQLRAATTSARQQEDAAHERLEVLRQEQLTGIRDQIEQIAALAGSWTPAAGAALVADSAPANARQEKLARLRQELRTLGDQCTDEHPQVQTLRSDITALERQLAAAEPSPASPPGARPPQKHFVSSSLPHDSPARPAVAQNVTSALTDYSRATAARQDAEARLAERMHELSTRASGVQWTKSPPLISRLGGTPRCSTLMLAAVMACVTGVWVFRAAAADGCSSTIRTPADLASAIELPVAGNLSAVLGHPAKRGPRLLTPARLKRVVNAGEAVLAIAVGACLLSIAIEPTLAPQVLADPFGALSEVLGRFGI